MESSCKPPTSSTKRTRRPGVSAVVRGRARCCRSRKSAVTAREGTVSVVARTLLRARHEDQAGSVREHQDFDGHPALGGVGGLRIGDGAQADGVDPRQLDPVLDEIAAYGLDAALAELHVVVAVALGIGIPLELHHQLRVLLQLAHERDQRRLGGVVEVGAVESELDGDGVRQVPHVASVPEAGEPAVDLFGLQARVERGLVGGAGLLADAVEALAALAHGDFDALEALSALAHRCLEARGVLTPLGVHRADTLIDLGCPLAQCLLDPATRGHAARRDEQHARQQDSDADASTPHTILLLARWSTDRREVCMASAKVSSFKFHALRPAGVDGSPEARRSRWETDSCNSIISRWTFAVARRR